VLNIGPGEMLLVLVVALLVLGPNKLPDAARQVGRAIGEMRKLSSGFQAEMKGALHEPVDTKPAPGAKATKAAKTGGTLASPRAPAGDAVPTPIPSAEVNSAPATPDAPEAPAEPGTDGATAT
jgi:sec-independent protein translocase protein TatA